MHASLVIDALNMAAWTRRGVDLDGVICHSDAGKQGEFEWSSQHLNTRWFDTMYKHERQQSLREMRGKIWSPGRPSTARREHRLGFWKAIARGLTSEDAAAEVGMSSAFGTRPRLKWCDVEEPQDAVGSRQATAEVAADPTCGSGNEHAHARSSHVSS